MIVGIIVGIAVLFWLLVTWHISVWILKKLTPKENEPKDVKWILVHKETGKHIVPKNNTHFLDCNLTPRRLTMSCDGGMVLTEMEDYEVEFL